MKHKVTFIPNNVTVEAEAGETIMEVALANGIELEHNCGGNCCCTTCHIIVREGQRHLSRIEEEEVDRLDECAELTPTSRLGCQAKVRGDVMVEIPARDPFRLDGLEELESFGEDLLK
jgi:ferredoxin, 2Fe-2S